MLADPMMPVNSGSALGRKALLLGFRCCVMGRAVENWKGEVDVVRVAWESMVKELG